MKHSNLLRIFFSGAIFLPKTCSSMDVSVTNSWKFNRFILNPDDPINSDVCEFYKIKSSKVTHLMLDPESSTGYGSR